MHCLVTFFDCHGVKVSIIHHIIRCACSWVRARMHAHQLCTRPHPPCPMPSAPSVPFCCDGETPLAASLICGLQSFSIETSASYRTHSASGPSQNHKDRNHRSIIIFRYRCCDESARSMGHTMHTRQIYIYYSSCAEVETAAEACQEGKIEDERLLQL